MRRDFRRFGNHGSVNADWACVFLTQHGGNPFQNIDAADTANRFVGVRKMAADVFRANRAEKRIRNRMRQNIGIRMTFEPARVRDFNAAENQFSAIGKAVDIVTNSGANHRYSFKSMTPLDAMMLYLSFISVRGRISTVPPAVSTRI